MKIAITGTIGSGKSEISKYIKCLGYNVFDCDKVNSELLLKGNLGYLAIQKAFPQVFDGEELNKAKLADLVFNDEKLKSKLEDIMHPLILNRMKEESSQTDVFFAEVPLLFEANWDIYFDLSILVVSDTDLAIERLIKRGLNSEDVVRRIKSQMSVADKLKRADEIIYNNGSLLDLYRDVDTVLDKYVR